MRHILLHGHIFKNAGTTLDWALRRSFGAGFLDHRDDERMRREGAAHLATLLEDQPGLVALSSHHLSRDLPELPHLRFHPVFLVRHPLLRMRSVYDFERLQQADTRGARMAKELSFVDYVAWRMRPDVPGALRNYQTFYLARGGPAGRRPGRNPASFERAMAYVCQCSLVGVVELYDESMVLFEHRLRRCFPQLDLAYLRQNVTAPDTDTRQDDQRVAAILGELGDLARTVIDQNSYDLALYKAVVARLRAASSRIPGFGEHLAGFRERCAVLRQGGGHQQWG